MDYSSFRSIPFDAYDECHSRGNSDTITNRVIRLIEACGIPLPGSEISKTGFLALIVASSIVGYFIAELCTSYVLLLNDFGRSVDGLSHGELWSVGGIWLAVTLTMYRVLASFRGIRRRRTKVHYHVC